MENETMYTYLKNYEGHHATITTVKEEYSINIEKVLEDAIVTTMDTLIPFSAILDIYLI